MKKFKLAFFFLAILVLAHIGLSIFYLSVTPYRTPGVDLSAGGAAIADIGAPDERAHANYVQWLLDGKGWPVLDVAKMKSDPTFRAEQYESHQPPLYYGFEALVSRACGLNSVQEGQAKWVLRLPNVLFGALNVVAVFFLALIVFRKEPIALLASLFPALLPMSTALSSAVSNDPLLILLSTVTLAFSIYGLTNGWTLKRALLVTVLLGLACWTKTTGLLLALPVLYSFVAKKDNRISGKLGFALGALFCLICAPLWIHNLHFYGDPLAASAFNRAFSDTATHSTIGSIISNQGGNPTFDYWFRWVGWWTFRSFIGVFGYMDIWLNGSTTPYFGPKDPNTLYLICFCVCLILSLSWLRAASRKELPCSTESSLVLGIYLFLVVASFLFFNNHYFQAQGRYLYPAIGAISLGLGFGAQYIAPKRVALIGLCLFLGLGWLQFRSITILPSAFSARARPSASI